MTSHSKPWSWFAADKSKAYFEAVSLVWSSVSLVVLLVGVLGTGLRHHFDKYSYLFISIALCVPGIAVPLLFPCGADKGRPLRDRFWVKAAVWIAIFSFYGNYFWTHYFYQLLGARYLFDAHRFNDVPIVCFFCTFFYFTFYFAFVNVVLRAVSRILTHVHRVFAFVAWWTTICALAYGTAVFEAVSIQHFPLYTYTEKEQFVKVGSVVYALYFVVGFPMFFALDERPSRRGRATLYDAAVSALAATAIVTLLLDLWRLYLGSIYNLGKGDVVPVPFIYQGRKRALSFLERVSDRMTVAAVKANGHYRAMIRRIPDLNAIYWPISTCSATHVSLPTRFGNCSALRAA